MRHERGYFRIATYNPGRRLQDPPARVRGPIRSILRAVSLMASKFSLCNMTGSDLGLVAGGRTERMHLRGWRYSVVSLQFRFVAAPFRCSAMTQQLRAFVPEADD